MRVRGWPWRSRRTTYRKGERGARVFIGTWYLSDHCDVQIENIKAVRNSRNFYLPPREQFGEILNILDQRRRSKTGTIVTGVVAAKG